MRGQMGAVRAEQSAVSVRPSFGVYHFPFSGPLARVVNFVRGFSCFVADMGEFIYLFFRGKSVLFKVDFVFKRRFSYVILSPILDLLSLSSMGVVNFSYFSGIYQLGMLVQG